MQLTPDEKAMLDGRDGPAVQAAMDLLMRYGRALGAERLVETNNVVASISATTPFMRDYAMQRGGMDAVFSEFSLDSDVPVTIPKVKTFTTHVQLGFDPGNAARMGVDEQTVQFYKKGEAYITGLGVQATNTCTPYQVGNIPTRGEHCAWMESSAVIYCNAVIGARTNTEGRESVGAAMLTGRIPYWGYHVDENRLGTHSVHIATDVITTADWGMLGYWIGEEVQGRVPVIEGWSKLPNLSRLKHFGAAASSSGGVEMCHIVGVTPEANTREQAFGRNTPREALTFDAQARQRTWERLNSTAKRQEVDYVMLGCPHYTIEQIWEAARLLEGRRVHENTELWIFTPRAIKSLADRNGYTAIIEAAGGHLMTDSCSAMSRAAPKGTRTVALDSAKQAHYLPAILGVEAWFGSTAECIDAACDGRFNGRSPS
ncbi:aconitase X [Acidovorax sp.]|uniref:aconitase X n=1 Tax=Acidovorax sp. TaxID=1872122 RepID=UPI0040379109